MRCWPLQWLEPQVCQGKPLLKVDDVEGAEAKVDSKVDPTHATPNAVFVAGWDTTDALPHSQQGPDTLNRTATPVAPDVASVEDVEDIGSM